MAFIWRVPAETRMLSFGGQGYALFICQILSASELTPTYSKPSAAHEAGPHQDWTPHFVLRDHPYPVGCLAWSKDDSVLLTSSDNYIKLWNTKVTVTTEFVCLISHLTLKTGVCINTVNEHTDMVTALSWLPDGLGFISGGLDCRIIHWVRGIAFSCPSLPRISCSLTHLFRRRTVNHMMHGVQRPYG
jgi:WD40 repeat protein